MAFSTRREFLIGSLAAAIACQESKNAFPTPTTEASRPVGTPPAETTAQRELSKQLLREKVLSFSWEKTENAGELQRFVAELFNAYIQFTGTTRLGRDGGIRTTFYRSQKEFVDAVGSVEPNSKPTETQWGYTHYESRNVFIDLESLKRQSVQQSPIAGLALLDALWHEWGHLDVEERTEGELLNNPAFFFMTPLGQREMFKKYRGGAIYTDTYYGYLRFNEVWLEAITARRMVEQLGLEEIIIAGDHYENGVDFFAKFTSTFIPLNTLYQMYATSDFEGFAKLVGLHLPGEAPPLSKGIDLFTGIHRSDPEMIDRTGVLSVIGR